MRWGSFFVLFAVAAIGDSGGVVLEGNREVPLRPERKKKRLIRR